MRQARRALGGGAGTAISSLCAAFHVPFAHFPNWHFAQRFAGAAMACTREQRQPCGTNYPGGCGFKNLTSCSEAVCRLSRSRAHERRIGIYGVFDRRCCGAHYQVTLQFKPVKGGELTFRNQGQVWKRMPERN